MCDEACEYFKRSFFAVDGLWFMMVEDDSSFNKALEIDEKVWEVMPRIQSKKLRELYGIGGNSLHDLVATLQIKLGLEGYEAIVEKAGDNHAQILIQDCPWFNLMKKSGRESLADEVGERICTREYQGWADSFDENIEFTLGPQLCKGGKICKLRFHKQVRP